MTKHFIITILFSLWTCLSLAQGVEKKYWVSGNARNVFNLDEIHTENDSLATSKAEYGHTLIDLSANIKPNKNTFIKTTLRVRNEYGGFWGSGITFDIRELYMKGLIANALRYQLGDFQYKLTPFTFYNNHEEMYVNSIDLFRVYSNFIHYDNFYINNTWRQQGAAVDFSLQFKKGIEELQFNLFSSRLNPSNFSTISDRVFYGGNITMIQSDILSLGLNYVNLRDIEGTSNSNQLFKNPVLTASYTLTTGYDDIHIQLNGESGRSKSTIENDPYASLVEDFFHYAIAEFTHDMSNISMSIAYRNVGPNFRSTAAQTRRLKYTSQSEQYTRYTNEQIVRPIGLWDIYNDASLYNTTIETGLSDFYPQYNNIDPYGIATPNRKGLELIIERVDKDSGYEFMLKYGALSDVVGLGLDELKRYNSLESHLKIDVSKVLPIKKSVSAEIGYYKYHTNREVSTLSYADIDLRSQRINLGLNISLSDDFSILSAIEMYSCVGRELIGERDTYDEIIDFDEFDVDLKESIIACGLMYSFNKKNDLKLIYQDYSWDNTSVESPMYSFDRVSLVFNMKF